MKDLSIHFETSRLIENGEISRAAARDVLNYLDFVGPVYKKRRVKRLVHDSFFLSEESDRRKSLAELYLWYARVFEVQLPESVQECIRKVKDNVIFLSYLDLIERGWYENDIASDAVNLSNREIPSYEASMGDKFFWSRMREKNYIFYFAALERGELVGQAGFVPVTIEECNDFLGNRIGEVELGQVDLFSAGPQIMYIPSVVVRKGLRGTRVSVRLLESLFRELERYTCSGEIHVRGVLARAYSAEGRALAKSAGLLEYGKNGGEGESFYGDLESVKGSRLFGFFGK